MDPDDEVSSILAKDDDFDSIMDDEEGAEIQLQEDEDDTMELEDDESDSVGEVDDDDDDDEYDGYLIDAPRSAVDKKAASFGRQKKTTPQYPGSPLHSEPDSSDDDA